MAKSVVARKDSRELAPADQSGLNYFEQYGAAASQSSSIVGMLLKFSKGDWLAGESNDEIEEGTRFIANMDQLMIGWIKWEQNRPTQQLMGPVVKGFKPARRDDLDSNDQSRWEVGSDGKARDPWQESNYLLLKEEGDDQLYTFATASRGGINAVGKLCTEYSVEGRQRPDQFPIIAIGTSSYLHPNKEFGRIKIPTFEVVGWASKNEFDEKKVSTKAAKKKR